MITLCTALTWLLAGQMNNAGVGVGTRAVLHRMNAGVALSAGCFIGEVGQPHCGSDVDSIDVDVLVSVLVASWHHQHPSRGQRVGRL